MSSNTRHPHEKHGQILAELRGKIVSGEWPAGTRLPIRLELARDYKTTVVTVQKALHRLIEDGFVVARGRIGTFVSDVLPHLSHYALAFPSRPHQVGWTHIHDNFLKLRDELEAEGDRKIPIYLDVGDEGVPVDARPLLVDARARKLAGVVFVSPAPLTAHSLLDDPNLFLSAFAANCPHPRLPVANTTVSTFVTRAVERLAEMRRKSVAVIVSATSANTSTEYREFLPAAIASKGMTTRPHWIIPIHPATPQGARAVVQLLFDRDAKHRPDALIISDDHLVEEAVAGLLAADVRVPSEVEVIAHCNYPFLPASVLPVTWLGFDLRRVLRICLDLIDRQRAGERVPPVTAVSAQFANEVLTPVSAQPPIGKLRRART